MNEWGIIYEYCKDHADCTMHGTYRVAPRRANPILNALSSAHAVSLRQLAGMAFLALGFGGMLGPLLPTLRLEAGYYTAQVKSRVQDQANAEPVLPASVPVVFEPLTTPDGATIDPVNEEFALIVPKVGINAAVVANVDPANPDEYQAALETGIAHASTSFFPDEDGTVYLFSHSTNYDWFVQDLNAIFYLLKNLENDDLVVIMYKGKRYTYKITDKKVVSPKSSGYLYPNVGTRNLILQTCWPPGSTTQRLLIFADLIEEQKQAI